jgi:hypothetical protein
LIRFDTDDIQGGIRNYEMTFVDFYIMKYIKRTVEIAIKNLSLIYVRKNQSSNQEWTI